MSRIIWPTPGLRMTLKIPWHTTNIFMDDDPNPPVPSFFLNGLVHRYDRLKNFNINTVYPNYGLRQGQRFVIFHHGHFVESIYQLMTTLKNLIFPLQQRPTEMRFGTWRRKISPGSTSSGPPWGAPGIGVKMWKSSMTRCWTRRNSGRWSKTWPQAWRPNTVSRPRIWVDGSSPR